MPGGGNQAQCLIDRQHRLPLQLSLRIGGSISIRSVDPSLSAEGPSPLVVVRHIIPMGEHDQGESTQGLDPPRQWRTPAGYIHQHIALWPPDQPTAGTETAF